MLIYIHILSIVSRFYLHLHPFLLIDWFTRAGVQNPYSKVLWQLDLICVNAVMSMGIVNWDCFGRYRLGLSWSVSHGSLICIYLCYQCLYRELNWSGEFSRIWCFWIFWFWGYSSIVARVELFDSVCCSNENLVGSVVGVTVLVQCRNTD